MNPSQEPAPSQPGTPPPDSTAFPPPAPYGPAGEPYGPPPAPPYAGSRYLRSTPRPWRRTLTVAASVVLAITLLGLPFGLLWRLLAPDVPVIHTGSGIVVNDPSPEEFIAADGWFTLLGVGFGLLVPIAAWLILRRDRGPFLLGGVVVGLLGAGYLVAPFTGAFLGRDAYADWQETAARGATYMAPPEVHSLGPMLVPAFIAAIVLTLMAGWSNDPDLDHPGAKPGYGPNNPEEPPPYLPDNEAAYRPNP